MESRKQYKTELFMDRESAEKAYEAAIAQGYTPEEVNVMMSEESRNKYYGSDLVNEKLGDKSMEGHGVFMSKNPPHSNVDYFKKTKI